MKPVEKKTPRGFTHIDFMDAGGKLCALQETTIEREDEPVRKAIWFGTDSYRIYFDQELMRYFLPRLELFLSTGTLLPAKEVESK
jgi:hypothetical protein